MNYTLSDHAREVIDARSIPATWVDRCLSSPARVEADPTDADLTHPLLAIPENNGRVLRIVYDHAVQPVRVVTVFFDRRLRGQL